MTVCTQHTLTTLAARPISRLHAFLPRIVKLLKRRRRITDADHLQQKERDAPDSQQFQLSNLPCQKVDRLYENRHRDH